MTMLRGCVSLVVSGLVACCGAESREGTLKTPETSKLFVRHVDPDTEVVSYLLKPGLVEDNQQSIYFTSKCMTEDGRFLVFHISKNEWSPSPRAPFKGKRLAVIDFLKDEVFRLDDTPPTIPYVDVLNDRLYYVKSDMRNPENDRIVYRDLKADLFREIDVCGMPKELSDYGKVTRYCTHLTLSGDRKLAFLDARCGDNHVQGTLELATGKFEKWGETGLVFLNHGQINPVRNDMALCAYEVSWTDSKGVRHDIENEPDGTYPRIQLLQPGKRTTIPSKLTNYATHERWDEQGEGFYWCSGGVFYHDLKTGEQTRVSPRGGHAMMSVDRNYVISDVPIPGNYRGNPWQVYFYNRKTERGTFVFVWDPPLCENRGKANNAKLHPDAHPMFVCGDRYVVCTYNGANRDMNLMVTPVAPLIARTAANPMDVFADLPAAADPKTVGKRLAEHFLETPPEHQQPKGYDGKVVLRDYVPYAVCSLWVNSLDFAKTVGDTALEKRLTDTWEPFYGPKRDIWSAPYHVDMTIFGAVPYAVYLANGDRRALKIGNDYAETQWAKPSPDDITKLPKWLQKGHNLEYAEQLEYWKKGYSPQTRLWIDDMYMITVLQTQAYRATGERKYLRRAAEEAKLYLEKLQLRDGPTAGLFYHAPDVPFVWGRGDGWMAGGMPLILKHLPAHDVNYIAILRGYRRMMAALLKYQRADGLWGQLIDDPQSWSETSGSAMFTYAFIMGVKNGWLDPAVYGPAARKAWLALVGKLDANANIADVCIGTGKKNDHQYYLDRSRINGDAHGQAPMMWCVNALLEPAKVEERIRTDKKAN